MSEIFGRLLASAALVLSQLACQTLQIINSTQLADLTIIFMPFLFHLDGRFPFNSSEPGRRLIFRRLSRLALKLH